MTPVHEAAATATQKQSVDLAWREIDLAAVAHNVEFLAMSCAPAELMVVVKADAYSHGAAAVARTALASGATRLGVATIAEAFDLRHEGIIAPILAWLAAPGAPFLKAIQLDVELAAHSVAQLMEIAEGARAAGRSAVVHLKAETGMWRGGAADEWEQMTALAHRYEQEGLVRVIGVWSHLAGADVPEDPANDEQLTAFNRAVNIALSAGLRPTHRHLANSAATLSRPDMHFDMVRCGLAVYGVDPLRDGTATQDLKQAMTVRAIVTHVKKAPAGVGVSYSHTYRTESDTTLAIVPIGYADGVPVISAPSSPVGYRNISVEIAGRVCMDQLVLDVGDVAVKPGDEVTLLGPGDDGEYTAAQWAELSGRSTYEMLTGFSRRRVPLRFMSDASRPHNPGASHLR